MKRRKSKKKKNIEGLFDTFEDVSHKQEVTEESNIRKLKPWVAFSRFLFQQESDPALIEHFNFAITPKVLLQTCLKNPDLCIFFNKYFNNPEFWNINSTILADKEKAYAFYDWLRNLYQKFGLRNRYDLYWSFSSEKKDSKAYQDKIIEALQARYPSLTKTDAKIIYEQLFERLNKIFPLIKDDDIELLLFHIGDLRTLLDKCGIRIKSKLDTKPTKETNMSSIPQTTYGDLLLQIGQSTDTCTGCPLFNNTDGRAYFDSNIDLYSMPISSSKQDGICDILFIGEGPGQTEAQTQVPFTGQSGQEILRPTIKEIFPNPYELSWCIWNTVICRPPNNRTPEQEEVNHCRSKLNKVINLVKPKVLVAVGLCAAKSLTGNPNIKLKDCKPERQPIGSYNNIPVLLLPHPAYILRNRNKLNFFKETMQFIRDYVQQMTSKPIIKSQQDNSNTKSGYNLPRLQSYQYKNPITTLMLTDPTLDRYCNPYEWILIDCQMLRKTNQCVAIFRNKHDPNKIRYIKFNDTYCYYRAYGPKMSRKSQCKIIIASIANSWDFRKDKSNIYYGDIPIPTRYAHDILLAQQYYLEQNHANEIKDNPDLLEKLYSEYSYSIYFLDIENEFKTDITEIDPLKAELPICLITRMFNGELKTFGYVPKDTDQSKIDKDKLTQELGKDSIIWCNNEKEVLEKIIDDIANVCKPDIITGWNAFYDLAYIVNRSAKLGLNAESISPLAEFRIDGRTNTVLIRGIISLDMLHLYKRMTFSSRESYKLGYITQLELGADEAKLAHEVSIKHTYFNDYAYYIKYNRRDVEVLDKLNKKLGHISLAASLRDIARCDWYSVIASQSPLVDAVLMRYLEQDGFVARNVTKIEHEIVFPGAYVHNPKGGLFKAVTDLDFSSLYPSIIRTFNIGLETYIYKIPEQLAIDILTQAREFDPNEKIVLEYKYIDILSESDTNVKQFTSTKEVTYQELWNMLQTDYFLTINGCLFLRHTKRDSVIAKSFTHLLTQRAIYKKKWKQEKDPKDYRFQLAFKILANSIYGYLGFKNSRFFDLDLASAVTLTAQEAIKSTMCSTENQLLDMANESQDKKVTKKDFYDFITNKKVPEFKFVIYGDTDSLFLTLYDILPDDVKEMIDNSDPKNNKILLEKVKPIATQIENKVNELIDSYFKKTHFLDPNHQYLNVKSEWFGDIMLQLAVKKRYAVRLIEEDGYDLEVKGLDIRRSDYPEFSKQLVAELLDLIFQTKNIQVSVLMDFLKKKQKQFHELIEKRDLSLARPVTMTKDLNLYKKIPSHITAMLLWNEMEYPYFTEKGAKGYAFPILDTLDLSKIDDTNKIKTFNKFKQEHGNIKSIVVPDNGDSLPEYYIIDESTLYHFSVVDRVDLLIGHIVNLFGNPSLDNTSNSGYRSRTVKHAPVSNLSTW